MDKLPQPFWAVVLTTEGVSMAVLTLFSTAEKDIKIAIIGLAMSLITGALGYIGGHAVANAARNPQQPVEPA